MAAGLDLDDDAALAWRPGRVIADKYELVEQIGAGGMGAVHAARRLELGDVVAIKSILPHRVNPKNRARFLREARAAARIRHPNIVPVFDFGEHDGRPFMVMEYVDGPTLGHVLRERGLLPPATAVELFADVCKAVEAGHRRGVVHRDLKPGNVMLDRSDDGTETIKVLDFGLASLLDEDDQERSRANAMVGTCAYMSPESIEHGAVSPASDLFALGVILYEMVTGKLPFKGANAIATIMAVCDGVYTPPDTLVPELPDSVVEAITAALQRAPSERPGSALELAALALGRRSLGGQLVGAELGLGRELGRARPSPSSAADESDELPTEDINFEPGAAPGATPEPDGRSPGSNSDSIWTSLSGSIPREQPASEHPTLHPDDVPEPDSQQVRAALASPPFVGRKLELDTLLELLAASARDEVPIAVVLGDPGMGRTRLLRRFAELARSCDAAVLEGRFWGYEGDRAVAGETFARMLGGQGPALDPGLDRRSAFAELVAELEYHADGSTLVLILDDLHQAPSRDLEFLTYLVRGGQRAVPIVVVASARSGPARSDAETELSRWLLQLAGLKARTTLTLARFGEDELRDWLEAAFGRLRIRPRDLRRLEHASAGNPYFLSELVRHLVASERLHPVEAEPGVPDSRTLWVCEPLARDVLPEGVSSAIADQLASLEPPLRKLLDVAAVIGQRLRVDVLERASGLDEDELDERIDEAVARGLLAEEDPESGVDLRFRSATVQQVLYERLGNRKRRRHHAAVIAALTDLGDDDAHTVRVLAYHYRAIADWAKTLRYGLHAARDALARHDHDAAELALEHAAVALDKLGAAEVSVLDQLRLSALHGALDARVGRFAEGVTRLREARALSGHASEDPTDAPGSARTLAYLRFEVALSLARCHLGLGQLDESAAVGREALDLALALTPAQAGGEIGKLEAEWDARVALAHSLGRFGSWDPAIEVLVPVIEATPLPQVRVLHVLALRERGWLSARRGALEEAEHYSAMAWAEAKASGEPLAEYCAASVTAVTYAGHGDPRAAIPHYRTALRLARALSLRRREMIEQANLCMALVDLGEYDEALTHMLSVRAICRELGDKASAADACVGLGKILHGRGDLDEAIESLRRGHAACDAVGRYEYANIALLELGRCELERARWDAARDVLLQAHERFARMGSLLQWEVELLLARAARGLGDEPEALARARAAQKMLEGRRSSVDDGLRDHVDRGLHEVEAFLRARSQP